MILFLEQKRAHISFKLLSVFLILSFLLSSVVYFNRPTSKVYASFLPAPGQMVNLSPPFTPALLKGVTVNPEDPFRFDFIIEDSDERLGDDEFKQESQQLIKYFLAALTLPEDDIWVNLSPFEQNRVTPYNLGVTELGKSLLSQDYILKQLLASLMHPDSPTGEKFWKRVYEKAYQLYGTTNIPINTFNKVWIMPEKAVVQTKDNTAYVAESRLRVLLDEDYLALRENTAQEKMDLEKISQDQAKALNRLSSSVVKEIIIPELEKEVNYGKNFAELRQAYNALILAVWFKNKLKQHLVSQIYADKQKVKGVDLEDRQVKEKIYRQYIEAYKKGVYNYVKNDYDLSLQKVISRRYYGGGFALPEGEWVEGREVKKLSLSDRPAQNVEIALALSSVKQPIDLARDNARLVVNSLVEKGRFHWGKEVSPQLLTLIQGQLNERFGSSAELAMAVEDGRYWFSFNRKHPGRPTIPLGLFKMPPIAAHTHNDTPVPSVRPDINNAAKAKYKDSVLYIFLINIGRTRYRVVDSKKLLSSLGQYSELEEEARSKVKEGQLQNEVDWQAWFKEKEVAFGGIGVEIVFTPYSELNVNDIFAVSFPENQHPSTEKGKSETGQASSSGVSDFEGRDDGRASSSTVNIFESKELQKGILAAGEDGQQVFLPVRQISELSRVEKDRLANLLWGWIDDAEERGTPLSHQDRVYELYQALLLNMPYGQNSGNSQQRLYFALSNGSPDGGWSAVEAIVEVTEGKRANGSGQPARAVTWLQKDQRQRRDALQGAAQQLLWWVANKESKQLPSLPFVFDIRPSAFGNTLSDDTKIQRLKPYNQQEVDIFLDQHSRYTLAKFKETGNGDLAGTIYREFEPALSSASSTSQQPVNLDNLIKIWDRINQDAEVPAVYDKSGVPIAQPITQTFARRVQIARDTLAELHQGKSSEFALSQILSKIQGLTEREALRFLLDPSNPVEIAGVKQPYIDAFSVYELFLISEIIRIDLEDLVNYIHDFYSQVFPTPDIFAFLELVDTPIDFAIGIPSLNTRIITLGTMATTLVTGFIKYNESDPSKQENFSVNPPQEVNFSAVNGLRGWIPAQFVSEYLRAKGVKDMTFADFIADFADDSQEQRVVYDLLQKMSATPEQAKDVMLGLLLFLNAPCLIPEIDPLKAQDAGETDQASSSSASSPAQEVDRLEEIALHKGTRQAEQALSRIEALCAREDLEDSFYVSLARAITRITQSRKSLIRFSTVSALESLFTKRGLDVEVYLSAAGAVRTIRQQRKQLIRPHSLAEVVSKMPEDVARFSMVSWRVYYNQRFMAITKSLRASEIAKYSIALAAHDFLRQHKLETTDQDNITKAVNVIVQIRNDEQALNRRLFLDRVINILNSHQSFGSQKVETFERSGKNTIDSPYKGRNSKMPALEAVAGSQGPLTIFFSGFSNGEYLCLERRAIDSDPSNDPQDNIHFTELAEALLGRGDLENLTIILDACYSYNFSVRLLNYLNQKGVKGLPIVVTSSYYNQKSYAATLPDALAAVYVDKGSPLTVFDILKVDEKVFNFWQNATLIVPWSRESIREIIEQAKPETISSRPDVLLPEPGESMVPTVAASPLGAKETSPEVLNPKTSSPAQEKGVISIDERYEVLEEITSLGQKALRAIGRPYQMQVAVRDKQSGKKSEVTLSIHRGPAQVKRQKEHDLIITKDKIQHLTRIADGNRNQKQLVREIINGFDGEIYLYSGPMIGVFKVTLPQAKQAIAIHQDLAHNPISIFNAAAQYHMSISRDVERKKLWFEFKTKQLKVIVPNGNYFTLPLTSNTAIEIAEASPKDQNNLLQVLQRELFGDLDKVFQADLAALEVLNKSIQASPEQALYRVPYILSLYAKGQQRIVVVHQRIMPFGEFREWKRQELSSGRQVGKSESPFSIAGEDSRSFTNLLRALEEELAVTTNPTRQANIKDIKSKVLPAFEGKLSFASSSLTNEDFITIANADHRDLEAAFKEVGLSRELPPAQIWAAETPTELGEVLSTTPEILGDVAKVIRKLRAERGPNYYEAIGHLSQNITDKVEQLIAASVENNWEKQINVGFLRGLSHVHLLVPEELELTGDPVSDWNTIQKNIVLLFGHTQEYKVFDVTKRNVVLLMETGAQPYLLDINEKWGVSNIERLGTVTDEKLAQFSQDKFGRSLKSVGQLDFFRQPDGSLKWYMLSKSNSKIYVFFQPSSSSSTSQQPSAGKGETETGQVSSSGVASPEKVLEDLKIGNSDELISIGPGSPNSNYGAVWEKAFLGRGAKVKVYQPDAKINSEWQKHSDSLPGQIEVVPDNRADFKLNDLGPSQRRFISALSIFSDQSFFTYDHYDPASKQNVYVLKPEGEALISAVAQALSEGAHFIYGYYARTEDMGNYTGHQEIWRAETGLKMLESKLAERGLALTKKYQGREGDMPNEAHAWGVYRVAAAASSSLTDTGQAAEERSVGSTKGNQDLGGIDLTPANLDLEVRGGAIDLPQFKIPFDLQTFEGFTFRILKIAPIEDPNKEVTHR